MFKNGFILFLFPLLAFAQSPKIDCGKWSIQKQFEQENQEDRDYKIAIDNYFKQHSKKSCPDKPKNNKSSTSESVSDNMRCVSTKGISGLESLPCFHYQFVKAHGKSKGTIINFQGGPGDILEHTDGSSSDYDEISFNDIGVGDNSLDLKKRVPWKAFGATNQAEIVKRILKQEKIKEYVLSGGSFGTVTATQVGAKLSVTDHKPLGVLLVGIVSSAQKNVTKVSRGKSEVKLIQTGTDPDFSDGCVLKGTECVDHESLKFLTVDEQNKFKQKISELAKGSDKHALRALFRDAFHWEFAQGPQQGAAFLKRYLLVDDHVTAMSCWYDQNFLEIPWLNRFKSASQLAFYQINNCFRRSIENQKSSGDCVCLPDIQEYQSSHFQIKSPTKIYYINGTVDSQTPIEGAERHFDEQKNPEKAFLKICEGGHMPLRNKASFENRIVSEQEVFNSIFNGTLADFQNINGYCPDAKKVKTTVENSSGK